MKGILVVTALIYSLVFSSNAFSLPQAETVQQCAKLLPSGYKYKLLIDSEIVTGPGEPEVEGDIKVSVVAPGQVVDLGETKKVFINCVISVMKEGGKQYY